MVLKLPSLSPAARVAAPRVVEPDASSVVDPKDREDLALVARAKRGDRAAFAELVARYSGRVFATAVRMLNDRQEAEDLTQEVFVALFHHLDQFRGEAKLSTWVYRITRNRCLNRIKFLKRRHVFDAVDIDAPGMAFSDTNTASDDALAARDQRRAQSAALEQAIRQLPHDQRSLVILRDLEDLSYDDIAEVTGLPLGTVKSRLHRARQELCTLLKRAGEVLDLDGGVR